MIIAFDKFLIEATMHFPVTPDSVEENDRYKDNRDYCHHL